MTDELSLRDLDPQEPFVRPTAARARQLSHDDLAEFRDQLHLPEFSVAASIAEIDVWLRQLDAAVDAGEIDPRPSWVIERDEEREAIAARVVELLATSLDARPSLIIEREEEREAIATRVAELLSTKSTPAPAPGPVKIITMTEDELRDLLAGAAGAPKSPHVGLLTKAAAAEALGISESTLDRMRREPGFPEHHAGDDPRFDLEATKRFMASRKKKAGDKRADLRLVKKGGK